MGKAFASVLIEERSIVSYVKREIHLEVLRAGFTERKVAEIDLIVSEMTSNIIKHAKGGEILYRTVVGARQLPTFEVICVDQGPGMSDTARMMKDGMSTTGTLGQGLGAIDRLSSVSQVYSIPGWGTILYALVNAEEPKDERPQLLDVDVRALCVNKPRETVCGDGYRVRKTTHDVRIFFGDGLGHGPEAKAAVDSAGNFFMDSNENSPMEMIRQMHERVRRTRGLVTSIAIFDKKNLEWRICGVGNISVRLYTGLEFRNYMSFNGTVGLNIPKSLKDSTFDIEKNQHLIMASDGIRSRWNVSHYPSIFKYDNTILATALYRDNFRGNDDASVLVAKVNKHERDSSSKA